MSLSRRLLNPDFWGGPQGKGYLDYSSTCRASICESSAGAVEPEVLYMDSESPK